MAGSPFAKVPPVKMTFIPGITRTPNQSDVVMSFRKEKDRKKEKEKKKKTCKCIFLKGNKLDINETTTVNPFDLLDDEE